MSAGGHSLHAVLLLGGVLAWAVSLKPGAWRQWPWHGVVLLPLAVMLVSGLPVALDWLHLLAMSLWIGDLVQLLLAVPRGLRTVDASARTSFVRVLVPRFSRLALPCVIVLALTGVYSAWFHVREVEALTGTSYGLTVLAKVVLFLPLIALGALNLYLGSERLQRATHRFWSRRTVLTPRQFFGAVQAEVLLVLLVLLATGVLTSLSPAADVTSAAPAVAFSQTEQAEGGSVTLSVDPAIAGLNSIGVQLEDKGRPVTDASKVAVRFSQESQGIAESEAVAKPVSDGLYSVTGPQFGVPGTWKVEVVARRPGRDDTRAIFSVPVAAPRVAEAEGVRAELRVVPATPRAGEGAELELVVTDSERKPLTEAQVEMTLLMPAHAHYEDVVLQNLGQGKRVTYAQLRMSGAWIAQVSVERPGKPPVNLSLDLNVAE